MSLGRGAMRSEYMHWAKTQQHVRYALSSSEVPHFRLDSLPLTLADLEHLALRTGKPLGELAAALERLVVGGWLARHGTWFERVARPES